MPARSSLPLLLVVLSVTCLGCLGEPPLPRDGQSAVVTPEPPGANCPTGGLAVQVGSEPKGYVCNGAPADGATTLTVAAEPAGANCPQGGVKVSSGSSAPLYVCNGVTGATGLTGTPGDGGAGAVVTNEPAGVNCATGGVRVQVEGGAPQFVCNGLGGDAGASPTVTTEAPGANCATGGLKVQPVTGLPTFVCNGATGRPTLVAMSPEFDGSNCEVGGVRFDTGLDANGNGTLDSVEITQTRYVCNGIGLGTGFVSTRTPDPATVFNTIERTYGYSNCTNSIWNRQADIIVSGQSCDATTRVGYWAHGPAATYPATPDQGLTQPYARLVQVPSTDTVVFTVGSIYPGSRGAGNSSVPNIRVGTISRTDGLISGVQPAIFSDGYTGSCQLLSSSRTQLLCYDGATTIRRYRTAVGSATLTAAGTVTLAQPLSATAACSDTSTLWCMGGTFAWDGTNFYFATHQGGNANRTYLAFSATGALLGTFTATGPGNINGTYFDWSVGRYSTHDVFGVRTGGLVFGQSGVATHVFSPVSQNHTLY